MATPSKTATPITAGELLFQDYLDAMQYPYEFEREFPGRKKKPDFTITKNGQFLFDVKDFSEKVVLGFSVYDPYPQIREKIQAGKKKFHEFKDFPCSLVLKNNGHAFVHLDHPEIMLGAMYGAAGFTFPVDMRLGRAAGPLKPAFLGRGKMILPNRKVENTTISALITLRS